MTEEYPPLNYTENNVRKGQFVEILSELWKKVGLKKSTQHIQVLPWARSYELLQSKPGTALFAMSRTAEREDMFKWVGPIDIAPIGIIATKDKGYRFKSMSDINSTITNGRLGVVRNDSGEHFFLEKGGKERLLHRVNSGDQLIKMLDTGRFDAISYLHNVAFYLLKTKYNGVSEYEFIYPLTEVSQGWFGFHKGVDTKTIEMFQKAFDELVAEGVIEKINSAYLH